MSGQTTTIHGAAVEPSFEYDAFVSYRRGDGAWHARTLRQRLRSVGIPAEVRSARPDRRLHIYLDQVYERATDDFFENTIKPALAASRHLVVVKTSSTMNALPDGRSNWLVREIDYFRSLPPEGRSISVAVASGDLAGPLPGRLDETHPNIQRLDLRRWRWYRAPDIDDQLLSLAATLHEIGPADMPALRQEDARRHAAQKRTRRLLGAAVMTLVLAATSAAVWQYQRAREQSYRRSIATAASLWNRLDFADDTGLEPDELNALWEVRLAGDDVREAFISELTSGGDRVIRFGRRPAPVMRAIFLEWPEGQAVRVFEAVVRQTAGASSSESEALWRAGEATARVLPAGRVGQAVASVLAATKGRTERLAFPTLRALADTLTPVEAQSVVVPILNEIEAAADPDTLKEYWVVVRAFGGALTLDQAAVVRGAAVRTFGTTTEPDDLEMLCRAIGELSGALTPEHARQVLDPIAKAMAETTWALQTLGDAVAALAPKLPPEQAQDALAQVLSRLDGADPFATRGLAPAITALASSLPVDRARAALDRVLWATDRAKVAFAAEALVAAMSAILERVTPDEAQVVVPSVLATLSQTPPEITSSSIERAVTAAVARLEPSQAEKALTDLFASVSLAGGASPAYAGRVLTPAFRLLAGKLTAVQADAALARVSNELDRATSTARLETLAALVAGLSPRATNRQREALMPPVWRRMQETGDRGALRALASIASELGGTRTWPAAAPVFQRLLAMLDIRDVFAIVGVGEAFRLVSGMVAPDQARALLAPVLRMLEHHEDGQTSYFMTLTLQGWFDRGTLTEADGAMVRAAAISRLGSVRFAPEMSQLVSLIVGPPGRLTPDQGQAVLTSLLTGSERIIEIGVMDAREQIAKAMLTLAPQLTVEQRATVAIAMRSELAWAGTDAAALAAANALIGLSPREPEPLAQAIIEMLKYPAAAGPATDALLAVFREAAAVRGGDVDGEPTLAWVRALFPGTNLDAPPGCPQPRHAGLTCPATATVR